MALQSKLSWIPVALLGLLVAAMLAFTGCSTDPEPTSSTGGGDSDPNVNLSQPTASPAAINEGETSVVEVAVTDDGGDPITGTSVDFIVSPIGGGYFTPPTATTDGSGIASTIFTAQQSGTMSIAASAEGNQ